MISVACGDLVALGATEAPLGEEVAVREAALIKEAISDDLKGWPGPSETVNKEN